MKKQDYEVFIGACLFMSFVLVGVGIAWGFGAAVYEEWEKIKRFISEMSVAWILFWSGWLLFVLTTMLGALGEKVFFRKARRSGH